MDSLDSRRGSASLMIESPGWPAMVRGRDGKLVRRVHSPVRDKAPSRTHAPQVRGGDTAPAARAGSAERSPAGGSDDVMAQLRNLVARPDCPPEVRDAFFEASVGDSGVSRELILDSVTGVLPAVPPSADLLPVFGDDAAALLEAARGSRPRDAEGQNLENLDEQFYERLSKLRDDHQRNLNEISRLYESSVEAGGDGSEQPMMQQQMRSEPQPEMARPEMTMPEMMSDAEAGMADPDDNRPWWQRDDKDYGEVLRRLKALDIPLPPGAGGPSPSADTQDAERDKRALYSWSAEGGPGAGEGPWGEREAKTKRPASAPRARRKEEAGGDKDGWIARSTVPQPFKFDSRPKRPSIMAERTSYDLEVKRRLDQAECSTRFRAEPIPPTTMLPLFEKQEREKEAVRAKRVADRFQYLQETSGIHTQSPPRLEFQRGF